jgi:hypothetical protein
MIDAQGCQLCAYEGSIGTIMRHRIFFVSGKYVVAHFDVWESVDVCVIEASGHLRRHMSLRFRDPYSLSAQAFCFGGGMDFEKSWIMTFDSVGVVDLCTGAVSAFTTMPGFLSRYFSGFVGYHPGLQGMCVTMRTMEVMPKPSRILQYDATNQRTFTDSKWLQLSLRIVGSRTMHIVHVPGFGCVPGVDEAGLVSWSNVLQSPDEVGIASASLMRLAWMRACAA